MDKKTITALKTLRELGASYKELFDIMTAPDAETTIVKATTAMEEPVIEVAERCESTTKFARKTVTIREWLEEQNLDMPTNLIQRVGQSCSYRMKKSTNGCYVPKTRDAQALYPRNIIKQAVREIAGVPLLGGKEWAK